MKKILLSALSVLAMSLSVNAQAYMEGFEATNLPTGWDTVNLSSPKGTVPAWFNSANLTTPPAAAEGTDFFMSNYQTTTGNNTISTWLFSPTRTFNNGDVFSYYTETLGDGSYPDRMEVRMSTSGTSTNVGTTNTSVGVFTVVLNTINPTLTSTGYPQTWTKYSHTISGLTGPTSGRIAFRYFVTNGGPTGANSDAIGLDSVYYQPALSSGINSAKNDNNFRIFPNPSTGVVKINFATPSEHNVVIQNMLGEVVFTQTFNTLENSINLSNLAKGVYMVSIKENNVVRSEKLTLE